MSNSAQHLHPLHRLWRLLPAAPRRAAHARMMAALAPRPDAAPPPGRHGVVIAGEITRASGLGEHARVFQRALAEMGVTTWGADVGLPTDRTPPPRPGDAPQGAPLLLCVNAPMVPWALRRLPRALVSGRRVVGVLPWELQTVPSTWRASIGFVHEIWAPSEFSAGAFRALSGGRVKVRCVPIPLACSPPRPAPLGRADFGLPEDAVVVLVSFSLASSFERKNPLAAIEAFRRAFGDRTDRLLVLKVGNAEHLPADLARLRAAVAGAPNIRVETRMLPAEEAHALTACADIVLSLHRSEGFGLVPAEAMLLGRAVVATGWSGNMEFMDESCVALIAPRLVPVRDPRGVYQAPGAVWADPDPEEAAVHLRRLADDAGARTALGARGREAARSRLGAAALVEAVRGLGLPVEHVPAA
jgi:glycosyltransferase involved in cell wall biosynthesis